MGAISSSITAFLADITSEKFRTRAMAVLGITIGLSFSAAIFIGPFLALHFGLNGIFWITFVFCIIALIITIQIPEQKKNITYVSQQSSINSIVKILQIKKLIPVFLGAFLLHFSLIGIFTSIPQMLKLHSMPFLLSDGAIYFFYFSSLFFNHATFFNYC